MLTVPYNSELKLHQTTRLSKDIASYYMNNNTNMCTCSVAIALAIKYAYISWSIVILLRRENLDIQKLTLI